MKPFKLDQLDYDILDILEEDCSLTYNEIALKTGKNIWTVRDRMALLKQRGIVKGCSAEIDYSKLGLKCKASISFNLPADKIDEFISLARKEKRIKKIFISTGSRRFTIHVMGEECGEIRDYARKFLPAFGIYDIDFEVILDEIP